MDGTRDDSDLTRRANDLYWGSDDGVNQIAERLDLSKGALYNRIGPLPAGAGCPLCGAETAYANRTAREHDEVDCANCGWEGTGDQTVPLDGSGSDQRPARIGPVPEDGRVMLAGAFLGAALGLVILDLVRRRR
jgi:Zn ribbon nucleic-acid-binding protein